MRRHKQSTKSSTTCVGNGTSGEIQKNGKNVHIFDNQTHRQTYRQLTTITIDINSTIFFWVEGDQ